MRLLCLLKARQNCRLSRAFKQGGACACYVVDKRTFSANANVSYGKGNSASTIVNKQITLRNNDAQQKKPLVVIFGWGNGKLKHVVKYSELFERKDFTTVCVTTSLFNSLFRTSTAGLKESQNVMALIQKLTEMNQKREIFLYSFSNGGSAIFYLLTKGWNSNTFPGKNLKGTIFDSCPIVPNLESTSAVQKAFGFESTLLRPLINLLLRVFVYFAVKGNTNVQNFMEDLEQSSILSPQLFLFSKDDELAPYKDILKFTDTRRARGIEVYHKMWEKSKHCAHFLLHEDEYVCEINQFIDRCRTEIDDSSLS